MRKVIVCMMVYLITALSFTTLATDEPEGMNSEARIDNYISSVYRQIDFGKYDRLSYEVFNKAYRGYINLLNAGELNTGKEVLSVCDFSLPSSENRLWVIDLKEKKVLFNTYVAHGQGSGDDFATSFSNRENSHQSSLGFYVTTSTYEGEHGTSLHLEGMDKGYNDAAYDRGIVVHGADYVCGKFVCDNNRLGRSWGCPAVPTKLSLPIINTIKDSTCLFIYYPEVSYMNKGYWLNKKVTSLPETDVYAGILPQPVSKKPRTRVIQYITNGKVDSVVTIPATH